LKNAALLRGSARPPESTKLSRLSLEFDLRSSNSGRLYATASCLSRTLVNALSSIGN
jgi:hypothetical protein